MVIVRHRCLEIAALCVALRRIALVMVVVSNPLIIHNQKLIGKSLSKLNLLKLTFNLFAFVAFFIVLESIL